MDFPFSHLHSTLSESAVELFSRFCHYASLIARPARCALGLAGALAIPRRFRLWMPRSPRALRASRLVLRELWQSHQVLILPPTSTNKREERPIESLFPFLHCGGRIRTCDLRVMSPTRCHFSTPRYKERTLPCPFPLFGDYLLSQAVSNQVPSAM